MSGPSEFVPFLGRLHPLLVHLPIGLILLLTMLELLALIPRFRNANHSTPFILALAIPMSVFTVICGWLLASSGGYGQQLLQWHRWTGVGTAAACALAGLFYWLNLRRTYQTCLFSTFVALVVASHYGGSLTHGSDYLVRYAPQSLKKLLGFSPKPLTLPSKPKELAQLQPFADIIQPALQQDCVACHGPEKAEGELRLDSLAGLLKGGKSGPALLTGKSAESPLLKRLRLPLNEKEHMPPEGKPQPRPDQISVLAWWIDAGAVVDKTIAELKPPPQVMRTLQARYSPPAALVKSIPPRALNDVLPLCATLGDDLNIAITPLSPKEPWLQCNASIASSTFGDAELARLAPIGSNLLWLDLAGTKVTDAGLQQLGVMPNLVRLHLERTGITDAGVARLNELRNLEYLNLYGTAIGDAGLAKLEALPKLKQLYLWQTKVTPTAAKDFIEVHTDRDEEARIQAEIEQLQSKLKNDRFLVDLGTISSPVKTSAQAACNTVCPVSGKPTNPSKILTYEGKVVAFCCDDCKNQFSQDPKPFLSKLSLKAPAAPDNPAR